MNLKEILDALRALTTPAGPERVAEIRAALSERDGLDPAELDAAATEAFTALHTAGDFSEAAYADMALLADVVDASRELQSAAAAQEAETQAAVGALASRVAPAENVADGDPAQPDPAATDDPAGGGGAAPAAPETALVTASTARPAAPAARVPLGRLRSDTPPARVPEGRYEIKAAAEIRKVAAGAVVNGMPGLVAITQAKMESLSRAGQGRFTGGIAEIERRAQAGDYIVTGADADEVAINAACREKSLPGGSLVAAGGWCAPSETLFDFCDTASEAGILTLPTVSARRGGLRWPQSPDFSTIYGATGFNYTEAEIIAQAVDKPCYEIPCPPYSEIRLGAAGVCLTVPILTQRAFPELIRYTLDQTMAAHAHKMNQRIIAKMVALSIANSIATGTAPFAYGTGATAGLLGALELQIEWMRYRRRLDPNLTMEVVLPLWARGVLRSDLAKRNGVDLLRVTNAMLVEHFTVRNMNVQFVYDWQDALATGSAGDFGGGATPPDTWPATVSALIYPAGTFFVARNDIITVDGLYDSALLKKNMQMALFTEEGYEVGKRCNDSVVLTMPFCPNGETGRQVEIACPAA